QIGGAQSGRVRENVAAFDLGAVDAGDVGRDSLSGGSSLDGPVVDVQAPDSGLPTARFERCLPARAELARPESAGHNRADPLEREAPVDVKAGGTGLLRAARRRGGDRVERGS